MPVLPNRKVKKLSLVTLKWNALTIAVFYGALSLAWIFFSDYSLFLLKGKLSEDSFRLFNSAKGFAFVIVTAFILYFLISRSNKKLTRNRNEYRELYECNPSPMWIYDPQTLQFLSVNETAIDVYGYTRETFLSMTIKDIRPVEDHNKLMRAVNYAGRFQKSGVWRHYKSDGSLIYADISSNQINFRGHDAIMVLARDYTQMMTQQQILKKVNFDLAEEKKRLIDIQELSKIAAWDYFVEEGRLTVSDEVYKIFNVEKGLFIPSYDLFLKIIHRDDLSRFLVAARISMTTGEDLDIVHRLYIGKNNVRHIRQLGKIEYQDGKPYKIRGTMQDITEIKKIEQERNLINNENKKLDNIITRINNMVIILDTESRITWVNKAFEDFTGYSPEDVMGLRPSTFMMGADESAQLPHIIAAEERRETFSIDTINYTKANQPYWVNIEFTPMFDDGRFMGYITVHNDITTRKQKEEEVTKQNQILKNIAWLSSHEIRRPAASILGLMDLIRNSDNEAEKEEYLHLLNDCTLQLDEIIHQINQTIYEKMPEAN